MLVKLEASTLSRMRTVRAHAGFAHQGSTIRLKGSRASHRALRVQRALRTPSQEAPVWMHVSHVLLARFQEPTVAIHAIRVRQGHTLIRGQRRRAQLANQDTTARLRRRSFAPRIRTTQTLARTSARIAPPVQADSHRHLGLRVGRVTTTVLVHAPSSLPHSQ